MEEEHNKVTLYHFFGFFMHYTINDNDNKNEIATGNNTDPARNNPREAWQDGIDLGRIVMHVAIIEFLSEMATTGAVGCIDVKQLLQEEHFEGGIAQRAYRYIGEQEPGENAAVNLRVAVGLGAEAEKRATLEFLLEPGDSMTNPTPTACKEIHKLLENNEITISATTEDMIESLLHRKRH